MRLGRIAAGLAVTVWLCAALAAPAWAQTQTPTDPPADDAATATESPAPGSAEAARLLAEILRDPAARDALVAQLLTAAEGADGAAGAEPAAAPDTAEAAAPAPERETLARRIALQTQGIAEGVSAFLTRLARSVDDIASVATGERRVDWDRLGAALQQLALVAAVTLVAFWILKALAAQAFHAMARGAANGGWPRRIALLFGSNLVDALSIVLAWGGGYAFALWLGEGGRMNVQQSLFLNAFLLIELAKVVLRGVLAPRFGSLRLVPMGDETARYWYFWASRLIGLVGYGFLLVVPIVNTNIGFVVGRSLRLLIVLAAAVVALALIVRNRRPIRAALEARHAKLPDDLIGKVLATLGRFWHVLAIAYVVAVVAVWTSQPYGALGFMMGATVQSVVAVAAGTVAMVLISRAIAGGIRLGEPMKERLPLLETRLNTLVPTILKGVRLIVFAAVVVAIVQAWQLIDVLAWLASEAGREVSGRLVSAVLVLVGSAAVWVAVSSWIEYRLNPNVGRAPTARERTLLALFRNAFLIAVLIVGAMLALSELGVNIGPLLAGAGVLGLAIGFGAQKLVQDIITGAFIQVENAMNEGDVVTVGGISGVVEKLTIRSVGLRDLSGVYHLIPFSSVDSVSNFMKGFAYHVAEIGVAYREDVEEVKALMHTAFDRLTETEHGDVILAPLEMHGVTALADSSVVVRARIKTAPGSQWPVGRAYNEIVKQVLDEAGVEIPFPHLTIYMGENKDGSAPPLHVQQLA
ncbi:MAG: mechanosensitive ion channel, partial [Alphaproteobacteria bacterium]|nr:mechanosensitive ion channel [Alphaproteobacteria bacterium]